MVMQLEFGKHKVVQFVFGKHGMVQLDFSKHMVELQLTFGKYVII